MINKRICSAFLAGAMLTSLFPITTFAASVGSINTDKITGEDTVQGQKTVYSEIQLSDTSTNVFLTVDDSELLVSLPSTVIVSGTPDTNGKYIGEYSVGVEGDMAANKIVTIEPESYSTELKQVGKDNEQALISQQQTSFTTQDFANKTTTTGSVTAQGLTAGFWNSEFNFVVNINKINTFYSSLSLAAQDINDGTIGTENSVADLFSAQEAACGAFSNSSGYSIEVLKNLNEPAITLNKNVSLNLNNHTLNFNNGAGLTTNNDLSIKNGTINTINAARSITSNSNTSTLNINNVTLNTETVTGFNSALYGIATKSLYNNINNLNMTINNISANTTIGINQVTNTAISNLKNTNVDLDVKGGTGVSISNVGTMNLSNIDVNTVASGAKSQAKGILSNNTLNLLNYVNIKVHGTGTTYSNYGIDVRSGTLNVYDANIYSYTDIKEIAGNALNISKGATANIHGGVFETSIDTKTSIDGTDCANAGIINKGTLNIDETNGKVIVKGGNCALSINDTTAVVKINGGTYSAPNHGGLYNLKSNTIDINSAYFYNSKTTGEIPTAPCTAYGGMYSSGVGTITVTNSTVIGGNHGYRQKDANTNTTFKNTHIEGQSDVFSVASGTLNIGEGVTVKSKTGVLVEANPTGTINDPNNILGLN